jgi:hypothetical protein
MTMNRPMNAVTVDKGLAPRNLPISHRSMAAAAKKLMQRVKPKLSQKGRPIFSMVHATNVDSVAISP